MRKWPYLRMIFFMKQYVCIKKMADFCGFCRLWAVCGAFLWAGQGGV